MIIFFCQSGFLVQYVLYKSNKFFIIVRYLEVRQSVSIWYTVDILRGRSYRSDIRLHHAVVESADIQVDLKTKDMVVQCT